MLTMGLTILRSNPNPNPNTNPNLSPSPACHLGLSQVGTEGLVWLIPPLFDIEQWLADIVWPYW